MSDTHKSEELQEIRRAHVRRFIADAGGARAFSEKLGGEGWSPSYLSQIAGRNPTRPITEKTARDLEEKLSLPSGALDKMPSLMTKLKAASGTDDGEYDNLYVLRDPSAPPPEEVRAVTHIRPYGTRDVNPNLLAASMQVVAELVGEFENDSFHPGRHGKIVALVYEDALHKGAIDPSYVRDLLEIAHL